MAHYKPKTSTAAYSQARIILLAEPWLKYKEVHERMTSATCQVATVQVYGASIRHEIGCELKSSGGKETLFIDYDKYKAACETYKVNALTPTALASKSTLTRKVEVKEQLPPPPEVIHVPDFDSIVLAPRTPKQRLNKAFEDAEIRLSLATHETIHLEVQRKNLMLQVAELDAKIASWRQQIDETNDAMELLLKLSDAPESVVNMVLGSS